MPLDPGTFGKVRGAYELAINMLGVSADYENPSGTVTASGIIVGFRNARHDDTEVVNAYGTGVVYITVAEKDMPVAPEKFGTFTINGNDYVIQAAPHYARLNANTVGWRIIATGK